MSNAAQLYNNHILNHAMADYTTHLAIANNKHKKLRANMEIRRKLEIKIEERRLQRAIADFCFNE